ncbi:MAG: hypothetical protein AAFQ65_04850 [Myxococcota bacterium]
MKRQDRKRSSALRGANVLLPALAVGLTACGDDDEGTDPTAGGEQSNPGDGNDSTHGFFTLRSVRISLYRPGEHGELNGKRKTHP